MQEILRDPVAGGPVAVYAAFVLDCAPAEKLHAFHGSTIRPVEGASRP